MTFLQRLCSPCWFHHGDPVKVLRGTVLSFECAVCMADLGPVLPSALPIVHVELPLPVGKSEFVALDGRHLVAELIHPRPITDEQIRGLRASAAEAGDLEQTAICDRALDELSDWDDTPRSQRIADQSAVDRAMAMTVAEALAECVRVVTDGEAMEDDAS